MGVKKYKLIILDRDGVINQDSKFYIKSPDEWIPISGSLEAIAKLNKAGYKVAVASNQSGIARGLFSEEMLQRIHAKMHAEIAKAGGHLDAIVYCPHHPDDNCDCRKPKPKMLLDLMHKFNASAAETIFIGDKDTDVETAQAAGCDVIQITEENNLADVVEKLLS